MLDPTSAQQYLDSVIEALKSGGKDIQAIIDAYSIPIYMVDRNGELTFSNRACIEFAGREPQQGEDRWCAMGRTRTTAGEPQAHDQCPMAAALREQRPVRGEVTIAERPDGSRKAFACHPAPLFDEAGQLTGAVSLILEVSEEQVVALAEQAARCRRLSAAIGDRKTSGLLDRIAEGFAGTAAALRA